MRTWLDVQMFINRHKLPVSLFRFNMGARLINLATGDTAASTVAGAEIYLHSLRGDQ